MPDTCFEAVFRIPRERTDSGMHRSSKGKNMFYGWNKGQENAMNIGCKAARIAP
jgi:hypothetical protein